MVEQAQDLFGHELEGRRFGRYVLHQRLARGGMASVYLAQLGGAHGFERWVAVKVVHPHLSEDRRFVQMFLDEARLASRIHHQNVCQVIDFGEEAGTAYLVMEYMNGETLASVVRRAKEVGAPIWLGVRAVVDAARGLHAAHELSGLDGHPLGLVHRDVSPQNLMVLYEGFTKVMDFGVARARGRIADTSAQEIKGKIAYMAPEQLEHGPVDRRTDVWALGVLLWESTVRRRLFRGDNEGATALNVVSLDVPRPTFLVDSYSDVLEEIVMAALTRDPDRRFSTAAELADALEGYLYSVGRPTGHAQVGQWMGTAFRDRREQRAQLLRSTSVATLRVEDEPLLESQSSLGSLPSGRSRSRIARRRRTSRAPMIAGAVGLFLLGGVGAWGISAWNAEPAPRTRAPSGAAAEPGVSAARERVPAERETSPAEDPAAEAVTPVAGDPVAAPAEEPAPVPAEDAPVAEPAPGTSATAPPRRIAPPRRRAHRRVEPVEEPARETGTLNLLAIPTAEVSLGGRSLGRTPLVGRALPAGQHVLTLTPLEGGPSKRIVVRIRPNENTRTSVALSP